MRPPDPRRSPLLRRLRGAGRERAGGGGRGPRPPAAPARAGGAGGAPVASAPAGGAGAGAARARATAATAAPPDISGLTQQATIATPASIPGATPTSSSGVHGRFDPGTRIGARYRIVAL